MTQYCIDKLEVDQTFMILNSAADVILVGLFWYMLWQWSKQNGNA